MVFCYKIVTESPGRSPRKVSPIGRLSNIPSSVSQLISSLDYESSDVLASIPQHDWKLLAALARKREEERERASLARHFHSLWRREKEARQMFEEETSAQYKQYLKEKRDQERSWREHRRWERELDEGARKGELISCIRHKEKRSKDALAFRDDQKATELVTKAIEEDARALIARDRRERLGAGELWRRRLQLEHAEQRADEARRRKEELVRDAAQRTAISNALSSWESALLRQEYEALDACRRARAAAAADARDERCSRRRRARDLRNARAARLAAITAQMREAVREGRY